MQPFFNGKAHIYWDLLMYPGLLSFALSSLLLLLLLILFRQYCTIVGGASTCCGY
jgi:hypothetical protein